jgi:hypothetical protein
MSQLSLCGASPLSTASACMHLCSHARRGTAVDCLYTAPPLSRTMRHAPWILSNSHQRILNTTSALKHPHSQSPLLLSSNSTDVCGVNHESRSQPVNPPVCHVVVDANTQTANELLLLLPDIRVKISPSQGHTSAPHCTVTVGHTTDHTPAPQCPPACLLRHVCL